MAESEVMMLLGVKDDLSRLAERVRTINYYLKEAEQKAYQNKLVAHWLNKLADVMYDADDILDECEAKDLVNCWISEGFVSAISGMSLEESGEEYYKELVNRCLFKIDPDYIDDYVCTMHDLVRDLAISVANGAYCVQGDDKDSLDAVMKHKSLRTIICFTPQLKSIPGNLFDKLRMLRVLDLSGTQIENLPCNIGNLIHLRLLDVSGTRLRELPKSMDLLVNLQFLIVQRCKNLCDLPSAIVQLHKLRALDLYHTPLSNMPLGIGKLKDLCLLDGFVVTNEDNRSNMEELKSLSKLTELSLYHLERAQSENRAKEVALLGSNRHLTRLALYCDNDVVDVNEEDNERIKQVFNELQPPPCIEMLVISGFFGREVPTWLFPPYQSSLCNLNFLRIDGASAVVTIGPEFLDGSASAVVTIGPEFLDGSGGGFPKLEYMQITNMPNWEDWQLARRPHDGRTPLLPRLKELILVGCPKLKSIPECLLQHSTSMMVLHIRDAGSLGTLVNLSASVKEAKIWGCPRLEAISNLQVQDLDLRNCPALKKVENVGSIKSLTLYDDQMEALPSWLKSIMMQLLRLNLRGNPELMRRCLPPDGLDWLEVIQHISHVKGFVYDSSDNFSYTKSPFSFNTNIAR
ncbi:putative disease resistance protein [Acorus gramineus]|uniref:Disease resistance protein n=1 Tax=Acorus gramineus TaxID=55184 RepID=A0AAV9A5B4_ACOGR|nr:putative disease resistance protein [Acorus gramineus]